MESEKLSFIDHLEELRKRIIISIFSVSVFAVLSFFFTKNTLNFVIRWINIDTLYFFAPTEAFMARIKIAIFLGIFFSFPIILYETWAFIGPGLTRKEKRISLSFILSGLFLFLLGIAFAIFLLVPFGIKFFFKFGSESLKPLLGINKILEFIFWCLLGSGLLFQLPLLVFFLIKLGIIQRETITRHRPEFITGILFISALITPTGDAFTLILLSFPLILLIELSILLTRLTTKKK